MCIEYQKVLYYCNSIKKPKNNIVNKRNQKLTLSQEQKIVDASKSDPFKTATEIHKEVELKNPVSVHTIRNVLIKNDLRAYTPVIKPKLSLAHKANRLLFAEDCSKCDKDFLIM